MTVRQDDPKLRDTGQNNGIAVGESETLHVAENVSFSIRDWTEKRFCAFNIL